MLDYRPQPLTPTALLLQLAEPCARLGLDPRRVSEPRALLLLAHCDHEREALQLGDALASVLGAQPPQPAGQSGEAAAQAEDALADWADELDRAQAALAECDCCFHLPLDHPFGERLDPPDVYHWLDAPAALGAEAGDG